MNNEILNTDWNGLKVREWASQPKIDFVIVNLYSDELYFYTHVGL